MPGMRELEENIAKLEAANEETRAATREAHEAIKTAKLVLAELHAAREALGDDVKKLVYDEVAEHIKKGLEDFNTTVVAKVDEMYEHIEGEHRKLHNILIYGNEKGKGESIITDWVRRAVRDEIRQIGRRQ